MSDDHAPRASASARTVPEIPPPSSEVLIRRIVRKRLRALQEHLLETATGQKASPGAVVFAAGPVPLIGEGHDNSSWGRDPDYPFAHLVATPQMLDFILPDAAIGQRRPSMDAAQLASRRRLAMLWIMLQGLEVLVHYTPAITRSEFLTFVARAWPPTRGGSDRPQFDAALIRLAHGALIREAPEQHNSKTACLALAERLGVSFATIRRALERTRRARTKKPTRKPRRSR